jgi:hypothetical protein
MLDLPFFTAIASSRRILLAGAGGGFDIFCGLPLYFALRDAGKEVFLANLSFTALAAVRNAERMTPALLQVTADAVGPGFFDYFPEGYLAQWFRTQGQEISLYCFERTGVVPLREGYEALVAGLELDTLILIDGGTDSLMRGDEFGLGTPHEDIASIATVADLPVANRLLVCLGFGIDDYHGVCHADYLEAVAELIRNGGFLGTFSLLPSMPEVQRYQQATAYVHEAMANHPSIVNSSILSAIEGRYGDYHATRRTAGSRLWINPLMTLYWCFQLDPVARRILYLDALKKTTSYAEVQGVIRTWRATIPIRKATTIPL